MLLILTGTIAPGKQNNLVLSDVSERLQQYVECIRFFINSRAFDKIIFCDNSAYKWDASELIDEADKNKVRLELLSFQGNAEAVARKGKGFGEGEIMEYIFSESKLIAGEDYFVKVTGRLQVHNIKKLTERLSKNRLSINVPNHTERKFYDTRIYGMPVQMYKDHFLKAYEKVNDADKYFLECVFTDVIGSNGLPHRNLPVYPRITGKSGSHGFEYVYKEWKSRIKDVLSIFNFYGEVR